MKKSEILIALDGVDPFFIAGNDKERAISKLYLDGVSVKEIASLFDLSKSRIGQIMDKQARRANGYKKKISNPEYWILVEKYVEMYTRGETITLSSKLECLSLHLSALDEAKKRCPVLEATLNGSPRL